MVGKRRVDSFELHKLQTDANIKRMKKEKRLKVNHGKAGLIQTSRNNMNIFKKNILRSENRRSQILKDKTNQMNFGTMDTLKSLHDHTNRSNLQSTNLKITNYGKENEQDRFESDKDDFKSMRHFRIFDVFDQIRKNKSYTIYQTTSNNKYQKITEEIIDKLPLKYDLNGVILPSVLHYVRKFIEWFKLNKYDYIIYKKDLQNLTGPSIRNKPREIRDLKIDDNSQNPGHRPPFENHMPGLARALNSTRYRSQDSTIGDIEPSHMIEYTSKIGKFINFAKVRDLRTEISHLAFFIRADIRFDLEKHDLIILQRKPIRFRFTNGNEISLYMTWKIFRDETL
ncbi:uncharacterized protein PRCAT00000616001 [Priceomyces carsonii]|uniref:uncharacterized protein n=1 Tax=Priceomyces carsonii TaxID=28549 RepID=UPI002EDAE74B|nr:unnamed protein product [Priceomyces carsonii]